MKPCAFAFAVAAVTIAASGGCLAAPAVAYLPATVFVIERDGKTLNYGEWAKLTRAANPEARQFAASGFQVRIFPVQANGEPLAWPGPAGCHVYVTSLVPDIVMNPEQASFAFIDLEDLAWLNLEKGKQPGTAYYRIAFEKPNAEGRLFWLNDAQAKAYFAATLLVQVSAVAASQSDVDRRVGEMARSVAARSEEIERERPGHACVAAARVPKTVASLNSPAALACGETSASNAIVDPSAIDAAPNADVVGIPPRS